MAEFDLLTIAGLAAGLKERIPAVTHVRYEDAERARTGSAR